MPASSAFSVTADGVAIAVKTVSAQGSSVSLGWACPAQKGQVLKVSYTAPTSDPSTNNPAIQYTTGVDVASFTDVTITSDIAEPVVKINQAFLRPNSACEFVVSGSARVTVTDSLGRLGSSTVGSTGSNGVAVSTTESLYSFTRQNYDAALSVVSVGALTTIVLGRPALVTVKLRWQ